MIVGNLVSFVVVCLTYVVTTFFLAPPAAARRGYERGPAIASPRCAAPRPGKGLRPLHSCDRDAL